MEAAGKQFKKRNAILACLRTTHQHPSAEMIHQMLQAEHPDISLATVYRNLNWFKQQGLVTGVTTVKGTERYDAVTEPHVHFVCTQCDRVQDLDVKIPPQLGHTAEEVSGCHVQGCQLTFTGICRECSG